MATPYYNIRKATVEDVEEMTTMQLAMAHETERLELNADVVRRGILYPLNNPNIADYYVAECGDAAGSEEAPKKKMVAMLMTTFEWSEWRAGSLVWIQSVYVLPEHRRRGVFNLMYRYIKEMVEASDFYTGIRLYVEEENERAIKTYESVGLKQEHYRMMKWTKNGSH